MPSYHRPSVQPVSGRPDPPCRPRSRCPSALPLARPLASRDPAKFNIESAFGPRPSNVRQRARSRTEQNDVVCTTEAPYQKKDLVGHAPDARAQAVAREHGVDISGHRARQVTPADFRRFTHILAADEANLRNLNRVRPRDTTAEVRLWGAYLDNEPIADPYYGGMVSGLASRQ